MAKSPILALPILLLLEGTVGDELAGGAHSRAEVPRNGQDLSHSSGGRSSSSSSSSSHSSSSRSASGGGSGSGSGGVDEHASKCWIPELGFTRAACCPDELHLVGNISCWWQGIVASNTLAFGSSSYNACCNGTYWTRTRQVMQEMMASATLMPYFYAKHIVRELDKNGLLPSRYVINFGAADGSLSGDDPATPLLLEEGYSGVAVEPDESKVLQLRQTMPESVKVVGQPATPTNVKELLEAAGAPKEPAFLKVDIDSFDCALLVATLRHSSPAVVQIEVNSEVPFPMAFAVHYDERFRHSPFSGPAHGQFSRGFFGCSATMAIELARAFGYDALGQAGAHDVLFMRHDIRKKLGKGYPALRLDSYTTAGIARAISVRSMKSYFGVGVGVSWAFVAETQERAKAQFLIGQGIEMACKASQGVVAATGECRQPYMLLDISNATDFARHY